MAVVSTIIAGIGLAVSAAGTATSYMGAQKQAKGQKRAQMGQALAEQARKKQMDLDSARKRRETIRQANIQRSQALATAAAQGATGEGGSALAGIEGTISGEMGRNILAINQNQEIGQEVFDANAITAQGQSQAAKGATMANTGSGITSLGGAITNNAGTIAKIGGWT